MSVRARSGRVGAEEGVNLAERAWMGTGQTVFGSLDRAVADLGVAGGSLGPAGVGEDGVGGAVHDQCGRAQLAEAGAGVEAEIGLVGAQLAGVL